MSKEIARLDEMILKDTDINTESIYSLETELKEQSSKEAHYILEAYKAHLKANKLQLLVETLTAEIVDELKKEAEERNKPIPPSAVSELRRTSVPLDRRYKEAKEKFIEAEAESKMLWELVKCIFNRGFRIQKLLEISERQLGDRVVYGNKDLEEASKMVDWEAGFPRNE
jgi:hypothetical protein